MVRITLAILALLQFTLAAALSPPSLAQEWKYRMKPRGTLRVVDLYWAVWSVMENYSEGLVRLDKDNNWEACLAQDWRWLDDRTIEFRLREGVRFHNGEKFNAEAVRVNWEKYKKLENPQFPPFEALLDETKLEIIDEYLVRFTLPEPDHYALIKFGHFTQFAPALFAEHEFAERSWGYPEQAGPWGTGPFKWVEGNIGYTTPSDRLVLEANEDYWDPRYPKVERVILDVKLMGDRKEAMRLCREEEGAVDIVSHIRPLDTLKVAESPFAKVVKIRDRTLFNGIFNQRKKNSKWKDIRLRKAVNYAINRKELWKYGAKGNAYNLEGYPLPPGVYGHNPELELYTYDTTKARALLAEAGYPDGFEVKIITYEAWELETQIIKRMLERIRLSVTREVMPYYEYVGKLAIPFLDKPPEERDWDIAFDCNRNLYGYPGASFLTWSTEGGDWRWNEYDPAYEEMFKDMVKTSDPKVHEEKVRQLLGYHYDQAHWAYIYSPLSLFAVNKEVNFFPHKHLTLRLKETSVTDNHWSVREETEEEVE